MRAEGDAPLGLHAKRQPLGRDHQHREGEGPDDRGECDEKPKRPNGVWRGKTTYIEREKNSGRHDTRCKRREFGANFSMTGGNRMVHGLEYNVNLVRLDYGSKVLSYLRSVHTSHAERPQDTSKNERTKVCTVQYCGRLEAFSPSDVTPFPMTGRST